MSIVEVTAYKIVCDEPDCKFETNDFGCYAFWADKDAAEQEWYDSDGQDTPEGKHYCPKHTKVCCADCNATTDLINDADDNSGDWWCKAHFEPMPEGPEEMPL